MRFQFLTPALSVAVCLGGCATGGSQREVTGAAVGAAFGGAAGLAMGGPTEGLLGATLGGVVGAAVGGLVKGPIINQRQYYRDTRGFCYWMDQDGGMHYDETVSC